MSEAQNKPVTIETRRDLLFAATKRRSVKSIFVWCFLAFAAGLLASFAVGGIVDIHRGDNSGDQTGSRTIDQSAGSDMFA